MCLAFFKYTLKELIHLRFILVKFETPRGCMFLFHLIRLLNDRNH